MDQFQGRKEIREARVYEASEYLRDKGLGIEKVIKVIRNQEIHYYFASFDIEAKEVSRIIRNHWSVEVMHNIKDVVMKEDAGKTKNRNLAVCLSILRAFSLNLIYNAGFKSPTSFIRRYSHNVEALINFF